MPTNMINFKSNMIVSYNYYCIWNLLKLQLFWDGRDVSPFRFSVRSIPLQFSAVGSIKYWNTQIMVQICFSVESPCSASWPRYMRFIIGTRPCVRSLMFWHILLIKFSYIWEVIGQSSSNIFSFLFFYLINHKFTIETKLHDQAFRFRHTWARIQNDNKHIN
jgi:hypothetical protein